MRNYFTRTAVLVLGLLLVPLPVLADEGTGTQTDSPEVEKARDAVLAQIRTQFQLPESDWKLFEVISEGYVQTPARSGEALRWTFKIYRYKDGSGGWPVETIKINAGASGTIYGVEREGDHEFGNLTHAEARKRAEAFLQTYAPDHGQSLVLAGDEYRLDHHEFEYLRVVDSVPVVGDTVSVHVENDGIISYYFFDFWSEGNFVQHTPTLTMQQANELYKRTLDLRPIYRDTSVHRDVRLLYRPAYDQIHNDFPIIDAMTGKMLNSFNEEVAVFNRTPDLIVTPGGPVKPPAYFAPLDRDAASNRLSAMGLIPVQAKLVTLEQDVEEHSWNFSYELAGQPTVHASLREANGELLKYWHDRQEGTQPASPKYSYEECRALAIAAVKKYFPERTGALQLQGKTLHATTTFTFAIMINGIPSEQNQVQVSVNPANGQIESMYINDLQALESTTYPDPTNLASLELAQDQYMAAKPLHLVWHRFAASLPPRLVYMPDPSQYTVVDALTGKAVQENETPPPPISPDAQLAAIHGHWAESSLHLFQERGWLNSIRDGGLNPDLVLQREELVHLLMHFVGAPIDYALQNPPYQDISASKFYSEIKSAFAHGWIAPDTQFRPQDTITREEAATILARVLATAGKTTATLSKPNYADAAEISSWATSAIALHQQVGLMQGNAGSFHPQQNITLAELCTLLVNLSKVTTHI